MPTAPTPDVVWRSALRSYRDRDPVVLALPRGGLPVAAEIASALAAPLDVVLVRKIGVPWQPELAMGALVEGEQPIVARNEAVISAAGIDERAFEAATSAHAAELEGARRRLVGDRPRARSPAAPPFSSTTASPPARPRAPRCRRSAAAARKR